MVKPENRRSRFGTRAKLFMALGAALIAIVSGEFLVRICGLAPEVKALWLSRESSDELVYMRSKNPVLGFELKPNFRNQNADLGFSLPSTNSHGQRDIERSTAKPPGSRRIILLGDSVVEGHGLRELEDTMSQQLEMLYDDNSVEVLNFGVSGYCTRSEVELLRVKGIQFSPDVVVIVFTENDFQDFNPEALQVDDVIERPEFVKRMFLVSHLFRLSALRFNWFQFGAEIDPIKWNQQAIGRNNVVHGLEHLVRLRSEHGFQILIVAWPRFGDEAIEDLHFMPGTTELIIERLGKLFEIPVLRISDGFRNFLAEDLNAMNPRLTYTIGDAMHPNRTGNKVTARLLKKMLSDLSNQTSSHPSDSTSDDLHALAAIEAALAAGNPSKDEGGTAYAIRYTNRGKQLEEEGRLAEAKEQYHLALHADPNQATAMHNLGSLALQSGNFGEAKHHFENALRVLPNMEEAHLNLGMLHAKSRNFDEALRHFNEVLRINPRSAKGHFNLGALFVNRGSDQSAEEHFSRAVELDPAYVTALFQLGDLKLRNGNSVAAQKCYTDVLKYEPGHAQAHNHLGIAFAQQGNLVEARQEFAEAIRIAPDLAEARSNLMQLDKQIRDSSR